MDAMRRICEALRLTRKVYNYEQTGEKFTGTENMLVCELIVQKFETIEALLQYAGSCAAHTDDYVGELKCDKFLASQGVALGNLQAAKRLMSVIRISAIHNICKVVEDDRISELHMHLDIVNMHVRSAIDMFSTIPTYSAWAESVISELHDLYFTIDRNLFIINSVLFDSD